MIQEPKLTLKLKVQSRQWLFLRFVLAIVYVLREQQGYIAPACLQNQEGHLDVNSFNLLQSRFAASNKAYASAVFISSYQVTALVCFVDQICKVLLLSNDDGFKKAVAEKLSLEENWDKNFYRSVYEVFNSLKDQGEYLQEFKEVMKMIMEVNEENI